MGRKAIAAALVAAAALALAGVVFFAGAYTVTQAMHPPRRAVAAVCPCMSHVACRDAAIEGDQHAWYFVPDRSNRGAILMLHGTGGTREDMLRLGAVFLRAGYSILVPDLRGWGASGGFVGFGPPEARDAAQWAQWMRRQPDVSRTYGFGVSLGGSILLESLDLRPGFRAVAAESAFADFDGVALERMRRAMPANLRWATPFVVYSGLLWANIRYRDDLWHSSAALAVHRSTTPVLLIHGVKDEATLPSHSKTIAAANPATTTLWLIPAAAHANAWATAGKTFEDRVLGFYAAH